MIRQFYCLLVLAICIPGYSQAVDAKGCRIDMEPALRIALSAEMTQDSENYVWSLKLDGTNWEIDADSRIPGESSWSFIISCKSGKVERMTAALGSSINRTDGQSGQLSAGDASRNCLEASGLEPIH